jgi:hypothetical protein
MRGLCRNCCLYFSGKFRGLPASGNSKPLHSLCYNGATTGDWDGNFFPTTVFRREC